MAKEKMIRLRGKSPTHRWCAKLFLEEVYKYFEDGYVLHPFPKGKMIPNFRAFPTCTLVTKEYAEELIKADEDAKRKVKEADEKAAEEQEKAEKEAAEKAQAAKEAVEAEKKRQAEEEAAQKAKDEEAARIKKVKEDLEALESLTKKDELKDFAKERDIDIPVTTIMPEGIKKVIRDSLKASIIKE